MKRSILFIAMLCSVLAMGTLSYAQPDPNDAPKGINPPIQMPGGGADWQKMTPAQRRETMQQVTEQTLRGAMTFLGYDPPTQTIIIEAVKEREKTLADVRDKNRIVARGLMAHLDDAKMTIALDNLRFAQEDDADARAKQIADLDKKLDFSHKPSLKAFLSLSGIISDDSAAMGGVLGNLMGALTNMGMDDPPKPDIPAAKLAVPEVAPAPAQ
ncbi:hypothetical protein IAD21_04833 [Abditibacteriota bacterium]|nr:hypothetical protein IAD21_04833 [Abditibacteriota bacterium]